MSTVPAYGSKVNIYLAPPGEVEPCLVGNLQLVLAGDSSTVTTDMTPQNLEKT